MSSSNQRSAWWLRTLHQWHWISSAASLVGMLLFAITGITLNHATQIEAKPEVATLTTSVPAAQMQVLQALVADDQVPGKEVRLPEEVANWLQQTWQVNTHGKDVEWSADEAYVSLPRPGGDAWLRLDLVEGAAEYEVTNRGWISWLNDLHKGRHTGPVWSLFIDVFAVACVLFCLTGLLILKFHAANRPSTWPLVGLGLLLPVLIALLSMH